MLIPRQAGLAVKAWSPEKTNVGEANGVNGPAGSSLLEVAKGCPFSLSYFWKIEICYLVSR